MRVAAGSVEAERQVALVVVAGGGGRRQVRW